MPVVSACTLRWEKSPEPDVAGGDSYRQRVDTCREAVADFLEPLWIETGGVRGVRWDRYLREGRARTRRGRPAPGVRARCER